MIRLRDEQKNTGPRMISTGPEKVQSGPQGNLTLLKGRRGSKSSSRDSFPKSVFTDPMSLVYSLGYKDRRISLSYDVLRRLHKNLSIISAIVKTRQDQVVSFCSPSRLMQGSTGVGFEIKHKDKEHVFNDSEKEVILDIENFLMNCGRDKGKDKRDDLDTFTKKFIEDLLIFDQGCLPAGTLIELGDGTNIPIENICSGMEVRTHKNGRSRVVTETMRRNYTGSLYTISSGGIKVTATDGHPFLVVTHPYFRFSQYRDKGIKPKWVEAKDIKSGHYLVYPKPTIEEGSPVDFCVFPESKQRKYPNIPYSDIAEKVGVHQQTVYKILNGKYTRNGPELISQVKSVADKLGFEISSAPCNENVDFDESFAFLCGAYCAEGSIGKSITQFSLADSGKDDDLVEGITECLDDLGVNYTILPVEDKHTLSIVAYSKSLRDFFVEHFGRGSGNLLIPEWLYESPKESRESFIIAYLLGDGSFGKQTSFSTTSTNLFSGIRILLSGLGIYARKVTEPETLWEYADYTRHNSERYIANLSGIHLRELLIRSGYFDVPTPKRSREPFIQDDDYFYIVVSSVTSKEVYEYPVFNMEVDEDNSYLANGIVSHNCFEIVPDLSGKPFEFLAIDGATIRIAATDEDWGFDPIQYRSSRAGRFQNETQDSLYGGDTSFNPRLDPRRRYYPAQGFGPVKFVQVVRGQIQTLYRDKELAFCMMNPTTDIYRNGYGVSNFEMLVLIITAHLYAEQYNLNAFTQGSMPKGLLNIKGANVDDDYLESFKRQWQANVTGTQNAFRTPVMMSDAIEYVNLQKTNLEMEYQRWLEYLIRTTCSVCGIDPGEVGYEFTGAEQTNIKFDTQAVHKLQKSKDRGLRPLLRYYAKTLTKHIISPFDDMLFLDFVGLDELTQKEAQELRQTEVTTHKTVNEVRVDEGLDPLDDGDVVLNATFLQYKQMEVNQSNADREFETAQEDKQYQREQDKVAQEQAQAQMQAEQQQPQEQEQQPQDQQDVADLDSLPQRSLH